MNKYIYAILPKKWKQIIKLAEEYVESSRRAQVALDGAIQSMRELREYLAESRRKRELYGTDVFLDEMLEELASQRRKERDGYSEQHT